MYIYNECSILCIEEVDSKSMLLNFDSPDCLGNSFSICCDSTANLLSPL